jgi:hypothetical protein
MPPLLNFQVLTNRIQRPSSSHSTLVLTFLLLRDRKIALKVVLVQPFKVKVRSRT